MFSDSFTHARIEVFQWQRLLADCGDDAQRARDVVMGFVDAAPQALARLAQAVSGGDAIEAGREAHSLRGRAQAVGAEALAWVSLCLAETARRGEFARTPALLTQIQGEFHRVYPRLEECL